MPIRDIAQERADATEFRRTVRDALLPGVIRGMELVGAREMSLATLEHFDNLLQQMTTTMLTLFRMIIDDEVQRLRGDRALIGATYDEQATLLLQAHALERLMERIDWALEA